MCCQSFSYVYGLKIHTQRLTIYSLLKYTCNRITWKHPWVETVFIKITWKVCREMDTDDTDWDGMNTLHLHTEKSTKWALDKGQIWETDELAEIRFRTPSMNHRPREKNFCLRGASDSRSASYSSLHWTSALVSSLDWFLLWILRPGLWLSGKNIKNTGKLYK